MTESADAAAGRDRRFRVVSSDLPADLETPVSAYLKLRRIGAKFLLESAEGVDRLGRYSFIGFTDERVDTGMSARSGSRHARRGGADPLDGVRDALSRTRIEGAEGVPGLLGAAVGYVGYDYAGFVEDVPCRLEADGTTPVCEFSFVQTLVVFDHLTRGMTVYSLVPEGCTGTTSLHDEITGALEAPLVHRATRASGGEAEFTSCVSVEEYAEMVKKAKRHIYEGDCFQIVLSRQVKARCGADGFEIYRRLRMGNPSPYMFYLDFGPRKVIGSSPEVLVKLTGRRAVISPIAGTRPRGASLAGDAALEKELLSDEKERAEHVMLVDLARNDLGRVCEFGSVTVEGFMRVERYSHVMHIVSDVFGRLCRPRDQFDLFRASFPAGTVTGAPKVRAMEIIDELEKTPRGIYAGAVGYFSPSGDTDTCIAIRTIVQEGEVVYLQAGAGIVADSDPWREFQETENKLAALKVAVNRAIGEST